MEFSSKTSIGKKQTETEHTSDTTNHLPIRIPNNNIPLCCIAIVTFTNVVLTKQKEQFKENLSACKQFMTQFNQIPKNMMVYSNNQSIVRTIYSYLEVICGRKYRNNAEISYSIHDLLKNKPVFLFSTLCYVRAKGIQYLLQNRQQYLYELIGNYLDTLNNYQSEIRGNSLKLICYGIKQKWVFQYSELDEVYGRDKKYNKVKVSEASWLLELEGTANIGLSTQNTNLVPETHKLYRSNSTFNPPSIKLLSYDDYGSMVSREDLPMMRHCRNCGKSKIGRFCHHCRRFNPMNKENMTYI